MPARGRRRHRDARRVVGAGAGGGAAIIGEPWATAQKAARRRPGFVYGRARRSSTATTIAAGNVITVTPDVGARGRARREVAVVVSSRARAGHGSRRDGRVVRRRGRRRSTAGTSRRSAARTTSPTTFPTGEVVSTVTGGRQRRRRTDRPCWCSCRRARSWSTVPDVIDLTFAEASATVSAGAGLQISVERIGPRRRGRGRARSRCRRRQRAARDDHDRARPSAPPDERRSADRLRCLLADD